MIGRLFVLLLPFRNALMDCLGATDLATFCYTIGYQMTDWEKDEFLDMTRDMPVQRKGIKEAVQNGVSIRLVGQNLHLLMMRIRNPRRYWDMFERHVVIRIWIVAVCGFMTEDEFSTEMAPKPWDMTLTVRPFVPGNWLCFVEPPGEWHKFVDPEKSGANTVRRNMDWFMHEYGAMHEVEVVYLKKNMRVR